jgi:two-component system response regulator GlrR
MAQAIVIHLINFCGNERLFRSLEVTLISSFADNVRCFTTDQRNGGFDHVLSSAPHGDFLIFLLITNRPQRDAVSKFIQAAKARRPDAEIIVASEDCHAEDMLDLVKRGASDFIGPPINVSSAVPRILRLFDNAERRKDPIQSLKTKMGMKLLVGQSPSFVAQTKKIPLIASCDGRVLILGETGTGKELFARAIHYLSPRMSHPFVPVSCGAIPPELLENEMFGHSKGAFTGATSAEAGLIREAEGGTLFLDEVDCLPLLAQTKLLRFLQESEYKSLGSSKAQYADVRVVAASNLNLEQAVSEGKVRQDFYYRLNVARIHLPALRDRRDDIPLLAQHFLAKYAHQFERQVTRFSDTAIRKLKAYDWPGNIRELENTIERAVMLSESGRLNDTDLLLPNNDLIEESESFQDSKNRMIVQFERTYLVRLMMAHHGNVTQAARAAKKNRRAFWELIRKHNIDLHTFRDHKTGA